MKNYKKVKLTTSSSSHHLTEERMSKKSVNNNKIQNRSSSTSSSSYLIDTKKCLDTEDTLNTITIDESESNLAIICDTVNDSYLHLNVTFDSISNSPCTSSDCLSSDEGYVGSFTEKLLIKQPQTEYEHHHEEEEEVAVELTDEQLKYYVVEELKTISEHLLLPFCLASNYLHDDNSQISLHPTLDALFIDDDDFNLKYLWSNEELNEGQVADVDWRKVFIRKEQLNEDYTDLCAYLYEIDMNIEYFKTDIACRDQNDDDVDFDQMLKFTRSEFACNLILYEAEISLLQQEAEQAAALSKIHLADIFAHADYIPEFVPGTYQDQEFQMDDLFYNDDLDETLQQQQQQEMVEDEELYQTMTANGDIFENYSSDDNEAKYIDINKLKRKMLLGDENDSISSSLSSATSRSLIPRLLKANRGGESTFRKPCVYMLNEGRCMRADCRFAHDLHNIPCKYWLEGECLKGESCEFLHAFAPTSNTTSTTSLNIISSLQPETTSFKPRKQVKDFNLNTLDFPELGTTSSTSKKIEIDDDQATTPHENVDTLECTVETELQDVDHQSKSANEPSTATTTTTVTSKPTKKSRKFKDNVLYSLSLPTLASTHRKKNIN